MDKMSFLETVRSRYRMRLSGLALPESKCTRSTQDDMVDLGLEVFLGRAGRAVVAEFGEMLLTAPDDIIWHGLDKRDCVELLLISGADSFRRLVLPFACLPWQLFGAVKQAPEAAFATLQALTRQHGQCPKCADPMFSKAP